MSENKTITNIKIAGIGGMGVLKASLILSDVLFKADYDVKKAEVHGMSQRGGSLCGDVRFGKEVFSPMIPSGEVDYLLILQDDQRVLYDWECNDETIVIMANQIDLTKLENKKTFNIAMLGLLSCYLAPSKESWLGVIQSTFAEKFYEGNIAAFEYGRSLWNQKN